MPLPFARIQRGETYVTLGASNDAVADLEQIDAAGEAGAFAAFGASGWHGRVEITQDVADGRGDLRPNLSLNTVFTIYASEEYMDT